jgi:hypothetical protein
MRVGALFAKIADFCKQSKINDIKDIMECKVGQKERLNKHAYALVVFVCVARGGGEGGKWWGAVCKDQRYQGHHEAQGEAPAEGPHGLSAAADCISSVSSMPASETSNACITNQ